MPASMFSTSGDAVGFVNSPHVVQSALSGYSDEAYTNAKKLSSTEIVGSNPDIDTSTETFIGQIRWRKPINPVINVASLTDSTAGDTTSYGTDFLKYVKSVRTHGAKKVNMQEVITREDGLAKIGRDFGETRAQDEHNAILSILKGVALSEMLYGAGSASGNAGLGGQTFDNDPANKRHGFYVDLGASRLVTDAATANLGAQRATGFLNAFGMAYKDYEPEYAYLITSPEVFASLRSANLVDEDRVVDGNVTFNTIFQGKFRLLQTRASQGFSSAELTKINTGAGVDIIGSKTSFIVLPGSLAMEPLVVPNEVEIEREAKAYKGGGTTSIWYRWGYVFAPAGYSWIGSEEIFPSDAEYGYAKESATPKAITSVTDALANTTGTWDRKFTSALSLGILPVFHS
jgi:hypothetical protein